MDSTLGESEGETLPQCSAGQETPFSQFFSVRVHSKNNDLRIRFPLPKWKKPSQAQ